MGRNLINQCLVAASEFVKLKLGDYCDEHVAELYQAVSDALPDEDLSGAAIYRKRAYLKRHYPDLCADAVAKANHASKPSAPRHPF
jgi:hypothetical protein